MNIFDFINQDEIDDLVEYEPAIAFMTLVRIAQRRLAERTRELEQEDAGWRAIEEARHGFMNVVVAAAKTFKVEPFASMEVPRIGNYDDNAHRQFKSDLDHYMTQLVLHGSETKKRDAVAIGADTRTIIRTYLHHLREVIDRGEMTDGRRKALLRRLADFEAELEKQRVSLVAVAVLAVTLMSAPGVAAESVDAVARLVGSILREVGEAKAAEDETRLLAGPKPLALMPPRKKRVSDGPRESFNQDLDDEIPF